MVFGDIDMTLALVQQQTIGINQEYFAEWVAYREEDLHKPMTPRAIKMLQKKLLNYSESEQERLICNAIEMNWRGVYWTDPPRQCSTKQTTLQQDLTDVSWAN
jgi:hypothetical protein